MDLRLSDEQILLRDSVRRFLASHYDYAARTGFATGAEGFSREIWTAMAEFGWFAVPLPEEAGGFGGDGVDVALVMTELGRVLAAEPYLSTVIMAAGLLADLEPGSPLIEAIVAGTCLAAIAEGSVAARRDGEHWVLQGEARMVLNAASADVLLVSAELDGGVALFEVAPSLVGIDSFAIVDDRRAAHLSFDGVRLAGNARIGGDAGEALAAMRDRAIAAACAEMLGGLEFLVGETLAYCQTRVQFRKPLIEFQVVRHRIAEMSVALEEARAAALFAALHIRSAAGLRARASGSAKAKIGRAARLIAREAVQLHGGMGVTEELSVGAYYKHAIAFDALFGPVECHDRQAAAAVRAGLVNVGEAMVCQQEGVA